MGECEPPVSAAELESLGSCSVFRRGLAKSGTRSYAPDPRARLDFLREDGD